MKQTQIEKLLREHNIRPTVQRLVISENLLNAKNHPTVDEIFENISPTHPTISLATVYKTVSMLKNANLVQEFETGDGKAHYDPDVSPHINLICRKCGQIEDLKDRSVDIFLDTIKKSMDMPLLGQRLDFYVICKKCAKKSNESH